MKKLLILILTSCFITLLTACSNGISQSEYDDLEAERNKAISNLKQVTEERDEFEQKYLEWNSKYVELNNSKDILSYAKLWAETAYDDNVMINTVSDGFLEVVVPTNEYLTSESVSMWYKKGISSITLLGVMCSEYPEYFQFERISISFLDKNNSEMFEVEMLKSGNAKYSAGTTTASLSNIDTIYDGLKNISK